MNQTIVEAVLTHGKETPDKLAVAFKDKTLTYGELCVQMKNAAVLLKERYHIQNGEKVMISAVSKPEYVMTLLAVQYLGAISIPIDKSAKEENIKEVYGFFQPRILLTDGKITDSSINKVSLKEFCDAAGNMGQEEIPYNRPEMNRVGEILFTTGTTGKPKGAMLTYGNVLASSKNTWHGVGMETSDIVLLPLPLNHSVGMRVLRTVLYIGATVILQNGFTFAKELERNIDKYKCTALVSVPASMEVVYRQMKEHFAEIMGNLRYIEFGAGSLSYEMKKKLTEILPETTIYNTWGSTETGGAIFLNVSARPDKLTSLGKPVDSVELKVVDPEGKEIVARDIDTAGRMVLKGDMQMAGYYQMPEETKEALRDGWLYTNDMVYTDEDGYVYMLGRADDIINVGGEKVSPIEVENIAQEYEEIRECACIGAEDPEGILGQIPVLFVVPETAGFTESELIKFISTRMEKYKIPQKIVQIEELPRNRMKKLNRKALKKMLEGQEDKSLQNAVIQAILSRKSIRKFEERRIPEEIVQMIVKAGISAPSGRNMQTWRFTVLRNHDKIANLKAITEATAKETGKKCYGFENPDTIILVSNDRRNETGIQDSACAVENILLAAQSYGLGAVWLNPLMTLCDEPMIREYLDEIGIPKKHIVWAAVAMGYPDQQGNSPKKNENVVKWID